MQECLARLERLRKEITLNRPGERITFAVERKDDGTLVGEAGLTW